MQQSFSIQKVKLDPDEWFSLSQKLNGVRGTVIDGKILSRQGKEMQGLDHILGDLTLLPLKLRDTVFDGELIRKNTDNISDNENFRIGTGILGQEDGDKRSIQFVIFDVIPRDEFVIGESSLAYQERLKVLSTLKELILDKRLENITVVETYYSGYDQTMINHFLEKMIDEGKEGLMLNRNTKYYRKRHNGILKVKRFYTVDLTIVGLDEGTGRLSGKLGAFRVMYKGNNLNVGSGMTDVQRIDFWQHKDELVGRVIEVKYKEESFDKRTGMQSLQFPIFVTLREEGKEESYF